MPNKDYFQKKKSLNLVKFSLRRSSSLFFHTINNNIHFAILWSANRATLSFSVQVPSLVYSVANKNETEGVFWIMCEDYDEWIRKADKRARNKFNLELITTKFI